MVLFRTISRHSSGGDPVSSWAGVLDQPRAKLGGWRPRVSVGFQGLEPVVGTAPGPEHLSAVGRSKLDFRPHAVALTPHQTLKWASGAAKLSDCGAAWMRRPHHLAKPAISSGAKFGVRTKNVGPNSGSERRALILGRPPRLGVLCPLRSASSRRTAARSPERGLFGVSHRV